MTLPTSEILLSLPPIMCSQRAQCDPRRADAYFATCDPPAQQLGSGGGAAHVLHQAWRASGASLSLEDWLALGSRIVVHGGGESRRLPAYAPLGKLSLPIPALRWARGQRLGQTLLDLNSPFLRQALDASDGQACALIASGDVLLRAPRGLPALPQADVVMLGMWAPPETAQHYGVLFCDRHDPQRLVTFLQKPSPDEIRERSRKTAFLIDVGAWLLSPRAVASLLQQCGWQPTSQDFYGSAIPRSYDLYGQWALHLGDAPLDRHAEVSGLSAAVAPISAGEFYHFGSTRDVVESIYELQNAVRDQSLLGPVPSLAQPKQFIQDAQFGVPVRRQENDALWVENCCIPDTWSLSRRHMLTGVPPNAWRLRLAEGTCLDFVPIGDADVAVRCYGYDDRFRGPLGDPHTQWLERPAREWFAKRGIAWHDADLDPETDLQRAALFPVWPTAALDECVLQWLIDPTPESAAGGDSRDAWLRARRLSARELTQEANLTRLAAQREAFRREGLQTMVRHGAQSVLYKLDLADTAQYFAAGNAALPAPSAADRDLMLAVHDRMFRSEVRRLRQDPAWDEDERAAFQTLASAIIDRYRDSPTLPQCDLAPDQIVWARSPVRVDLAGGWTDTPPYCLEQGGSVANLALNLNGQPPIQVFARRSAELTLRIRSIDLGLGEEIVDYEQLGNWHEIGNGFAIARAALALCGFHPHFHGGAYATLAEQLQAFGGGVDLSLLAAVPKGSGLGASSILAGATLGALNELCNLGWDVASVADRVSAVEQMLGSGGGWQDQFGGLLPGAKLLETEAGLRQRVSCRWLPSEFFAELLRADRLLLYYTGVTRVAHNVLGEIVRGMFLNDPARLDLLAAIGANGRACFEAVQRGEIDAFARCIQRSWELNQALDGGTNPPEVAAIVERAAPYASGLKLAGAGGGGFLFVVTRDQQASMRLRRELEIAPPNPRARFVQVSVSPAGLEVTRS